ncbi:MAG: hypothetical protein CME71_11335 [Halobacteriovorax sp.]|nr:hypothetical protein [Halobacteriovorax sp.]
MKSFILISLISITTLACTAKQSDRKVASVNALQPAVEQGEVWGGNEAAMMDTVARIFHDTLIESTGDDKIMRRDAHPKHHGCVASELEIFNKNLPEQLRVGLFKENHKYQGIVRFSNGDPNFRKADSEKDVRGMAVKLFGVPYQNYLQDIGVEDGPNRHDFVFMNADSFFIPNPKAYEKFMEATQGRFGVLGYLAFHWGTLGKILKSRVQIANSLDIDYASATPYKLGPTTMKMKFVSCKKVKDAIPERPNHDFLGESLESTLRDQEGCFDFYVQPNKDPKKNNIEDAMISWSEEKSPMIHVGQMKVKQQTGFRSSQRMSACENMTFNPWRAPLENRPVGGVNRIRLEVYLNQSKLRHEYNGL